MMAFNLKYHGKHMKEEKAPHLLRRGVALVLCAALLLSLLPSATLAAGDELSLSETESVVSELESSAAELTGEEAESSAPGLEEEVTSSAPDDETESAVEEEPAPIDDDVLVRLRAGELTKEEVDALVAQGLTVADTQNPHAIAPMALVPVNTQMDPKDFGFRIHVARSVPVDVTSYSALRERYNNLPENWEGPKSGEQYRNGSYITDYYPSLKKVTETVNGAEVTVDYDLTRLSYHDTTVYRVGYVDIDTADKETQRYVYVSSELNTGAASHFILPQGAQVMAEYTPVEYQVNYEVYLGGSPATGAGLSADAIFGADRPTTTTNQPVAPTVKIPDGYVARVYISSKDDAENFPVALGPKDRANNFNSYLGQDGSGASHDEYKQYERFPQEDAAAAAGNQNYGNWPLGMAPEYKHNTPNQPTEVIIDDSGDNAPAYFSLDGAYPSGVVGHATGDLTVRVVLAKRTVYTISNALWRGTYSDGSNQAAKLNADNLAGTITFDTATYGTPQNDVPSSVTVNEDGSYNYTWNFTATGGTGRYQDSSVGHYELRSLTINGDKVEIPYANNNGTGINAGFNGDQQPGPVVTLGDGYGTVQVKVTANRAGSWINPGVVSRDYVVEFKNVTRSLYVTTSELVSYGDDSIAVLELKGVELWLSNVNGTDWQRVIEGTTLRGDDEYTWATGNLGGNARFRLMKGYSWPVGADGTPQIGSQITYRNRHEPGNASYASQTFANTLFSSGPDSEGWYYITLNKLSGGGTGSQASGSLNRLSITAELQNYQVHYLNGIGGALQSTMTGELPTAVSDMPALDNNGGDYYNMVDTNSLVVNAKVPKDATPGRARLATFEYWVLTNAAGEPLTLDKDPETGVTTVRAMGTDEYMKTDDNGRRSVDVSKLKTYKGSYTADLTGYLNSDGYVAYSFREGNSNTFNIYLTAYWTPAAERFVYYITFNKINAAGGEELYIYHPSNIEILTADGTHTGNYAATDRVTYAKVDSTTVVFDPDSELVTGYKKIDPWYILDEQKNGAEGEPFVYENVTNYGELPVWFTYTLGGLTIKNNSGEKSTYTVTFTLPENNAATDANETLFFDTGFQAYLKGVSATAPYDEGQISTTGKYAINHKHEGGPQTFSHDLELTAEGSGKYSSATFDLESGESIIFDDLPAGTAYAVTQVETVGTGYAFKEVQTTETERGGESKPTATTNDRIATGRLDALVDDKLEFVNVLGVEVAKTQSVGGILATRDEISVKPGDTITYTVTVKNLADGAATVTVTDKLPEHLTFVSADQSGTESGGTVTWSGVALAEAGEGGDIATLTVTAKVNDTIKGAKTEILNQASALVASTNMTYKSNEVKAVYNPADLTISKAVSGGGGETNQTFSFTVKLTDAQNQPLTGEYGIAKSEGVTEPAGETITFSATGEATLKLSGGQHVTIQHLPAGAAYTVTEAEANKNGYTTTINGATTTTGSTSGTMNGASVQIAFINHRPTPAKVTLNGRKVLDDLSGSNVQLQASQFSFKVMPQISDNSPPNGPIDRTNGLTVQNAADGTIKFFEDLEFIEKGTYKYSVSEVMPETVKEGYTYDTKSYTVTVQVDADNNDPTQATALHATVTIEQGGETETEIVFTNTYETGVQTVSPSAKKDYNGTLHGDDFTLEIEAVTSGAPMPAGAQNGKVTAKNNVSGDFTFGAIRFTSAGTYEYKIREINESATHSNIEYDTTTYDAKVTVSGLAGTLSYVAEYSKNGEVVSRENVVFKNTALNGLTISNTVYNGQDAADDYADDVFHYTVTLKDKDGQPLEGTFDVAPTGIVDGNAITPDGEGKATISLKNGESVTILKLPVKTRYTVTEDSVEVDDASGPISLDPNGNANTAGYKVTVDYNATNRAEGAITESDAPDAVAFVNRKPGPAKLDEEAEGLFVGQKTLKSAIGKELAENQFSFIIEPAQANNAQGGPLGNERKTVKNAADGKFSFDDFFTGGYRRKGTYVYTIYEDRSNPLPGYTYDDTQYRLTVEVTDSGTDSSNNLLEGKEEAAYTAKVAKLEKREGDGQFQQVELGTQIAFENEYTVKPISIITKGEKKYNLALSGNEFTFELTPMTAGAPMPSNAVDGKATAQNNEAGHITFGTLTFTKPGTYTYQVAEVADPNKPQIDYDESTFIATAVVTDDGNGNLVCDEERDISFVKTPGNEPADQPTFHNTINTELKISNTVIGGGADKTKKFTYTLTLTDAAGKEVDGAFDVAKTGAVTVPGGTAITFTGGTATMELADGESVTILRLPVGTRYKVTQTAVTDYTTTYLEGNPAGTLGTSSVTVAYENRKPGPAALPAAAFTGRKTLTGDKTLEAEEFSFTITKDGSNPADDPLGSVTTVTNAAVGTIDFTKLFDGGFGTNGGVYTYTVKEVSDPDKEAAGYEFDDSEYTVTVTVRDQGKPNENLTATARIKVTKDGASDDATQIAFTNHYTKPPRVLGPAEVEPSLFAGTKVLTGATLEAEQFSFTFTPGEDNPSDDPLGEAITVRNDAEGDFAFCDQSEKLSYAAEGIYSYTVTEVDDKESGYTYDKSVYTVFVYVYEPDEEEATNLAVLTGIMKDNEPAPVDAIEFENSYKDPTIREPGPAPAEGTGWIGKKTLTGETLAENQFGFLVTPNAGNSADDPLKDKSEAERTVKNAANGEIDFSTLFTAGFATEGGVYAYTVTEVDDKASGYTYDTSAYTLTVTVRDPGEPAETLSATVAITKDGDTASEIAFENSYEDPTPPPIEPTEPGPAAVPNAAFTGKKTLTGGTLAANQFSFTVTPDAQNPEGDPLGSVTTVKNASDGKIEFYRLFSEAGFAKVGTYTYTIKEVDDQVTGYTYDKRSYTVTVTVEDKGGDNLKATPEITVTADGETEAASAIEFENRYEDPSGSGGGEEKPPVDPPVDPPKDDPIADPRPEEHFAYIVGYDDGLVRPQENMTRAEAASLLFNLLSRGTNSDYAVNGNPYSDVKAGAWYETAVSTLTDLGVFSGYPNGTFQPNHRITRAEFAIAAVRLFAPGVTLYDAENIFSDVPVDEWYARYLTTAARLGLVSGYPNGTFRPESPITRAEAITVINRILDRAPHDSIKGPVTFADNLDPGKWYYWEIQEAANNHWHTPDPYADKSFYERWKAWLDERKADAPEQPQSPEEPAE